MCLGQKPKSSELSNLVRGVREARRPVYNIPYPLAGQRRYEWISPFRAPLDYPKRNFDEIDRSALDQFMRKRNFDEIDLSNMPLPYATKRFFHIYGGNNIDIPMSGYDKKTYRQEYPMDEIDLSSFPIGSKRSNLRHQFDEIDLSSFPVGSKRARSGQFDEIDLSSFPIG